MQIYELGRKYCVAEIEANLDDIGCKTGESILGLALGETHRAIVEGEKRALRSMERID